MQEKPKINQLFYCFFFESLSSFFLTNHLSPDSGSLVTHFAKRNPRLAAVVYRVV